MDGLARFLRVGFDFMVRRRLRGVWLRGDLPGGGFVWASNHHSWWDGFVAAVVLWGRGREVTVLMDPVNLTRFGFLRRLGTRGTNELRDALRALERGGVVIVFPEGEMRPPGPLAPIRRGAGWLAATAGVPLVAVATRLVMRGHESPEAYLDVRDVTDDDLETALRRCVADLDEAILRADPREPLAGFGLAVAGRRSWDERLSGGRGT